MAKPKPDELEARIINRRRADGKIEISVYDPNAGSDRKGDRECRTGLTASSPAEADKLNRQIAEQMKAAGNRIGFKQM